MKFGLNNQIDEVRRFEALGRDGVAPSSTRQGKHLSWKHEPERHRGVGGVFSLFTLEDGKKVKTPWLDGVLERGLILGEKWYKKSPKLASVPEHLVLLAAIESADVMRQLQGFKAAGFGRKAALHYAHSHLADRLMYAGIVYALASETYCLKRDEDNPTAAPSFLGFSEDKPEDASTGLWGRPTAEKLRETYEFKVDFPQLIGPEATEHLIKMILAYDRWARANRKCRQPKTS